MMKFEYFAGEQRTKPWFDLRLGVPTASRLEDWLSVSKAKTGAGKPLKKRLDYEKELLFEKKFGIAFENYVNSAMQDGIDFEQFAIEQYQKIKNVTVVPVGAWYNEWFLASPDGGVADEGLVEVKVLKDNSFTDVLSADPTTTHCIETEVVKDGKTVKVKIGTGVIEKHWKQIQGQLFASGRKWCDYIAISLSTQKVKIIRVYPDKEFHEYLELALQEPLVVAQFSDDELFDFVDVLPEGTEIPKNDRDFSDNNSDF
jgi:hypothetical protein